jgi:phospholipid transport system substrate-binding protein
MRDPGGSIMKRFLTLLFLVLALAPASLPASSDSAALVRDATDKLQALIRDNRATFSADKQQFYAAVEDIVGPAFDVPYIAQLTLGKTWRPATPEQRSRFQTAFKNTLIRAYADVLLEYGDSSKVEWGRASLNGEDATVRATVTRSDGPPVALGFMLHRTSTGDWRAYDITVEGISLITSYRSQFVSEARRDGLDALIQRLESGAVAH